MNCIRVDDYFLPTGNSISNASFYDFENYFNSFNNEQQNVCNPKKCIPRRTDDEAGINMYLKRLEKGPTTKPDGNNDYYLQTVEPSLPTECCHHREHKTRRKFICNFAVISASCVNPCLEMERTRCAAFWRMIDQRPELQALMRQGEFEHINLPHIVEPRKPKDLSYSCTHADELRAKNKKIHDEERERTRKRKEMMDEIQRKSGQAVFARSRDANNKSVVKPTLDEMVAPPPLNFVNLVNEMNAFDKMVGNPVRTKLNPPSTTSLEWIPRRSNNAAASEGEHEGEWGGEDKSLKEIHPPHHHLEYVGELDQHQQTRESITKK